MLLGQSPPMSDTSWPSWVAGLPQRFPLLHPSWAGAAVGVAARCQAVRGVQEVPWAGVGSGTGISV